MADTLIMTEGCEIDLHNTSFRVTDFELFPYRGEIEIRDLGTVEVWIEPAEKWRAIQAEMIHPKLAYQIRKALADHYAPAADELEREAIEYAESYEADMRNERSRECW